MKLLRKHYDKVLLIAILLLTAWLAGYKIWTEGDANAYYTAAVTSMLKSWHNFFFASFDPGGFITVDKPAMGFWLQCLSALIFGVHGWSLILPEVLCSVVSVALLHHIVKRSFGKAAGLLAALFLALTPIFIAATRTNNVDASLVMVCLFALWAVMAAAEKGSLKLLILAVALIGLGFNIKMLQAYFYVPALYLVYFFTASVKMKSRVVHLIIATAVLAAVSLSWCAAVDLTPAESRPFVGSSATNSELDLAVGYNGIARVLEAGNRADGDSALNTVLGGNSGVPNEGGTAGFFRLFNREMSGQIGWLLILAGFGLLALLLRLLSKKETDKMAVLRQLLLWLGLFAPMYAFFSISGHFHRYYMIMFAPDLAALAAIAVCEGVKCFDRDGEKGRLRWQNLLLPSAVVLTAASQIIFLKANYENYSQPLVTIIAVCAGLFLAGLAAAGLVRKKRTALVGIAVAVGLGGLLAAPAYWAYCPIRYGGNASIPFAGPLDAYSTGMAGPHGGQHNGGMTAGDGGGAGTHEGFKPGANGMTPAGPMNGGSGKDGQPGIPGSGSYDQNGPPDGFGNQNQGDGGGKTQPQGGGQGGPALGNLPANIMGAANRVGFMGGLSDTLVSYMLSHNSGARFLVAVPNAGAAEPLIIRYGVGVMALGGFKGTDNAISLEDFIALVQRGELQYYWLAGNSNSQLSQWVEKNGVKVEIPVTGGSESYGSGSGTLYELSALKAG